MKIGVIGSGVVAQVLAKGFFREGYDVMIGSRDPKKLEAWLRNNEGIKSGSFADTAAFGELIVLAVKGTIADKALELCGREEIKGKIIIDTTNPIADEAPENGVLKFFTGPNSSLMEKLQLDFPEARFVKAFNSIGNAHMVHPKFGNEKLSMFYCGNDENAKKVVKDILYQFGFQPVDMGMATSARAIEPLCMLWCIPGIRDGKWNHGFRMVGA